MKWIEFKEGKGKLPIENSWVLIESSLKNVPKYEVCMYRNGEWYLPSYDDSCEEGDIVAWCYIEERKG